MNKHNRRDFLKMVISGITGIVAAKIGFRSAVNKKDKSLKEARFYKKHHLTG